MVNFWEFEDTVAGTRDCVSSRPRWRVCLAGLGIRRSLKGADSHRLTRIRQKIRLDGDLEGTLNYKICRVKVVNMDCPDLQVNQ